MLPQRPHAIGSAPDPDLGHGGTLISEASWQEVKSLGCVLKGDFKDDGVFASRLP